MHLTTELVQRVLHGEPVPEGAQAHLAGCATCREAVATSRAEEARIFALLGTLDTQVRTPTLAEIRRARRPIAMVQPARIAAGLALAAGLAGVAYALPGSPVRRWIASLLATAPAPVEPKRDAPLPPTVSDRSGVTILPGTGTLVAFTDHQASGHVRVVLADAPELDVQSAPGAGSFIVGSGGVTIANGGTSASYDVRVPRGARRVEIRVAGVRVWLKDGARIASSYRSDADGVTHIPLVP